MVGSGFFIFKACPHHLGKLFVHQGENKRGIQKGVTRMNSEKPDYASAHTHDELQNRFQVICALYGVDIGEKTHELIEAYVDLHWPRVQIMLDATPSRGIPLRSAQDMGEDW